MPIDALLTARISDAVSIAEKRSIPKFVGFVEETVAEGFRKHLERASAIYMFYGGHKDAQRVLIGVFPKWAEPTEEEFPITRLAIVNKSNFPFTHRDVLGALMSCGIGRDTIGDILVDKKRTVVFAHTSISKHILAHLDKVKNCAVKVEVDTLNFVEPEATFSQARATVASARIDCVVAELTRKGRSNAAELINSGKVLLNGNQVEKLTSLVKNGDKITVRGYGKFVIDDITGLTQKGRLVLIYKKYS